MTTLTPMTMDDRSRPAESIFPPPISGQPAKDTLSQDARALLAACLFGCDGCTYIGPGETAAEDAALDELLDRGFVRTVGSTAYGQIPVEVTHEGRRASAETLARRVMSALLAEVPDEGRYVHFIVETEAAEIVQAAGGIESLRIGLDFARKRPSLSGLQGLELTADNRRRRCHRAGQRPRTDRTGVRPRV